MSIKLYEASADDCCQSDINNMAKRGEMPCIFEGKNHKEVLDWFIHALNDEVIDTTNNFHTIIED